MDVWIAIAWLYWNPPREAFTIPFLDLPVLWYGILFVSGFVLGYFIMVPILARFLARSKHLSAIDVLNWSSLYQVIQSSDSPLVSQLLAFTTPPANRLLREGVTTPSDPSLKNELLFAMNRLINESSFTREDLERFFQGALASPKQTAGFLTERLCWFAIAGTVIGARLGEVFFYNWPYYSQHPLEIFKTWHGGLASHGGVIGVVIAVYIFLKYAQKWVPQLTFLRLLDFVSIPSALVAFFIRMGNFMNQEILGTPTKMPWGIIFGAPEGNPRGNPSLIPSHPVQLYEGLAYLITFFILWRYWKKREEETTKPGAIAGLLFIFIFGCRFILEFWKSPQESSLLDSSFLQMGQWLSIPFILIGFFLWRRATKNYNQPYTKNPS